MQDTIQDAEKQQKLSRINELQKEVHTAKDHLNTVERKTPDESKCIIKIPAKNNSDFLLHEDFLPISIEDTLTLYKMKLKGHIESLEAELNSLL